jgi:hypothetical protein
MYTISPAFLLPVYGEKDRMRGVGIALRSYSPGPSPQPSPRKQGEGVDRNGSHVHTR